jgi:hypothetical protein
MPTLHIQLTKSDQPIELSQDITSQHMRLKTIIVSATDPSNSVEEVPLAQQIHPFGYLIDLTPMGASTREITSCCRFIGENFYLSLPGVAAWTPGTPPFTFVAPDYDTPIPSPGYGEPIQYILHPNLGFDTGEVPTRFNIRTLHNMSDGTARTPLCDYYDEDADRQGLIQIDLYFEYATNDNLAS